MGQTDSELGVRRWSVIIELRGEAGVVEAKAHLYRPDPDITGLGLAVGDQLAAAHALSELANQLSADMASESDAAEHSVAVGQ